MSEYWKSTPKYWCKHCSAYVKDTPFERKQHESTAKHQGNLKRFLRGIQNDHERNERDKEKVKAEVDRLNKVVGGGTAAPSTTSKPRSIRKSAPTMLTVADQKKQWAQLAEMGIQVPDSARAELAMPGSWHKVAETAAEVPDPAESLSTGVRKRKHLDDDEEEEAMGTTQPTTPRGWGSTTRRYPGEDPDLDDLLSGSLIKKTDTEDSKDKLGRLSRHNEEVSVPVTSDETENTESKPKLESHAEHDDHTEQKGLIKQESIGDNTTGLPSVIPESEAIPVFRKRKAKARDK